LAPGTPPRGVSDGFFAAKAGSPLVRLALPPHSKGPPWTAAAERKTTPLWLPAPHHAACPTGSSQPKRGRRSSDSLCPRTPKGLLGLRRQNERRRRFGSRHPTMRRVRRVLRSQSGVAARPTRSAPALQRASLDCGGRTKDDAALAPGTPPCGVSDGFFAAKAGSPLVRLALPPHSKGP